MNHRPNITTKNIKQLERKQLNHDLGLDNGLLLKHQTHKWERKIIGKLVFEIKISTGHL
jgi:hypothetical protein